MGYMKIHQRCVGEGWKRSDAPAAAFYLYDPPVVKWLIPQIGASIVGIGYQIVGGLSRIGGINTAPSWRLWMPT